MTLTTAAMARAAALQAQTPNNQLTFKRSRHWRRIPSSPTCRCSRALQAIQGLLTSFASSSRLSARTNSSTHCLIEYTRCGQKYVNYAGKWVIPPSVGRPNLVIRANLIFAACCSAC